MTHISLIKLKIKIKHLALEPAIIRKEERKILKQSRWHRANKAYGNNENTANELITYDYTSLSSHRKNELRNEARASQLAYAFLRNVPYEVVEKKREEPDKYWRWYHPNIRDRAIKIANKYSPRREDIETTTEKFKTWLGIEIEESK